MTVVGTPAEWTDLIDPLVPEILTLIIGSWESMPPLSPNQGEDDITVALCRALRQNRTARGLMFQIHTQRVELEPEPGQELGRQDIVFCPLVPREDIYFCLESKRLNVVKDGKRRAYATEYVKFGMLRFISGQYSRAVRHGGMMGYVLDGDVGRAMKNVEACIRRRLSALGMGAPGRLLPSAQLKTEARARETHHHRRHEAGLFCLHHLFVTR